MLGYSRPIMSYKDVRNRYFLFARIAILVSLIAVVVLMLASVGEDPSHLTFSVIAFAISVAALLVTILQSVSIAKQVQITEKAAREVRETGEQLKELVSSDHRLLREVRQDIELDREIIAVLEEHGVGASQDERTAVAKRITQKLKKPVHE